MRQADVAADELANLPVGILLAAGRGRRFDASGERNKLLQPLPQGICVAQQSAQTMLACLPLVIAVVPPDAPELARILQETGCQVSVCASAAQGMAASLVHGVQFAQRCSPSAVLLALADMPFVQSATLQALLEAQQAAQQGALVPSAAICAPYWRGRRGNPVLFGRDWLPHLLALQGDQGARCLLQQWPVTQIEVNDPGILQDVDTASDLPTASAVNSST
jgi:molybdenum cofactor cytidylyltransferase